jgi:hypothetical protein
MMDWKKETTLADLPMRAPLLIKVLGLWEKTTPYDLLNGYRMPRFLTVAQVEFAMETEIKRDVVPDEREAILQEIALADAPYLEIEA